MRSILALVFGVSLFVSPLAMAGDLKPTDSNFLFKNKVATTDNKVADTNNKAAAITISDKEMKETQGQGNLLHIHGNIGNGGGILNGKCHNTLICL